MKTPKPRKIKKDFTITATQAKDLKLGSALVGLNALASHAFTLKRKNTPTTASWSLNRYQSTFLKISNNFIRYTELRTFANKLKLYLQDDSTRTTYTRIFNKLALEKEGEEADKDMNTIADINAKKLTVIAGNRLKRTFDKMIENGEGSSSMKVPTTPMKQLMSPLAQALPDNMNPLKLALSKIVLLVQLVLNKSNSHL
jgi:hypothetical protein